MSVTAATVLKKVAITLATNPKARKAVVGIVLGVLFILLLPIIAVLSIFSGDIKIDTNRLYEMINEQQTVAEQTLTEIEEEMLKAGLTDSQVEKAQVLYAFALYPYGDDEDFSEKLIGCFVAEQTDEELITEVNYVFGTEINLEEFNDILQEFKVAEKEKES